MTDWKSALRADPTGWLLDNACAPVRYRVLTEILALPEEDERVVEAKREAHTSALTTKPLRNQRGDGTWVGRIHVGDPRKPAPSTELTLSLLYEFGYDKTNPAIRKAIKTLKTFLTQKRNLNLYEFQSQVRADILRERYYRWFLRVLALGLIQKASPETGGKVMEGVLDLLQRVSGFVNSPISRHAIDPAGAKVGLIRRESMRDGYPFFPDYYTTQVFCSTPRLLDSDILKGHLKRIYDYALSDTYQAQGSAIGMVKTARGSFVKGWGLELRPIEHYLRSGTLHYLLRVLESLARLGLVNRYPLLMSYIEWLVSRQEKDGRWTLSPKYFDSGSMWGRLMRLERDWRSPARAHADVTFRICLILRYQWERQIRMLDRGDDPYAI